MERVFLQDLPADAAAALEEANREISSRGKHSYTVEYFLTRWARLSDRLDTEYHGTPDDYAHELSFRDALERVLDNVPEALRSRLQAVIDPIDERFRLLTKDDGGATLSESYRIPEAWWWRQVPRKMHLGWP